MACKTAAQVLESTVLTLRAMAVDADSGMLVGAALDWPSTLDGPLGTGEELQTQLSVENHSIVLTATAPSNLVDSAAVSVDVLADSDGDGISDLTEQSYGCLSDREQDSSEDSDGDGLSSEQEVAAGTDPCDPDSDLDDFSDGEEESLGSNPLDGQSTPSLPL